MLYKLKRSKPVALSSIPRRKRAKSSWNVFQKEYATSEGVQGIFVLYFHLVRHFLHESILFQMLFSKIIAMYACVFFCVRNLVFNYSYIHKTTACNKI